MSDLECEYCHNRMPKEKVRDNNRCILCGHQMMKCKTERKERKLCDYQERIADHQQQGASEG